tara:strand:+ start:1647 stop:2120 length:474 start_codon:yes stop_codon:yes gene_type:complete
MEIVKVYSTPFNLARRDEEEVLLGIFYGLDSWLACRHQFDHITSSRHNYLRKVWINADDEQYDRLLELTANSCSQAKNTDVKMVSPFKFTTISAEKNEEKFIVSWNINEKIAYCVNATDPNEAREKAYDQLQKNAEGIFLDSIEGEEVIRVEDYNDE